VNYQLKSKNQLVVELFMALTGDKRQVAPLTPTPISDVVRQLRARLMLEECLETIQKGLGVRVEYMDAGDVAAGEPPRMISIDIRYVRFTPGEPSDLVELADGLADCEVVNLGTASAAGIAHQPIFEEVMRNNLAKFGPGSTLDEGGKLLKPPGHKPPVIKRILQLQSLPAGAALYVEDLV
jgi:predicted HAD superfamily Cof-like phosphohydrolase